MSEWSSEGSQAPEQEPVAEHAGLVDQYGGSLGAEAAADDYGHGPTPEPEAVAMPAIIDDYEPGAEAAAELGSFSAAPDPEPEAGPYDHLITEEQDGHPDGYAVASGAPGVSGRWVTGTDRADAVKNWIALYEAGTLNEEPASA